MAAKFEIKKATSGQFYFNLRAGNNEVILTSQQYKELASAKTGIDSVKANVGDDGKYERKTATDGQQFFVLKAANGETIGKSEMYKTAAAMEKGIASVKANAPGAAVQEPAA